MLWKTAERATWLLPVLAAVWGCAQDPQQMLLGQWQVTETYATLMAAKIKADSPGASTGDVVGAAAKLRSTSIELRADKTFTLKWDNFSREGDWTFDPQTKVVALNIQLAEPLPGTGAAAGEFQPVAWSAELDVDQKRLRFFPVPAEAAALMKSVEGPMKNGIPLAKVGG